MDIVSIGISAVIYCVLLYVIAKKVIKNELYDMTCPDGPDTKDMSQCKDGNGKLWARHKYVKTDNVGECIDKMSILNKNYNKPIMWRRCILMGFVASILVFSVTQQRLPSGFELLGSTILIFIVFYVATNYYRHHHDRFIEESVEEHLKYIKTRLKKK